MNTWMQLTSQIARVPRLSAGKDHNIFHHLDIGPACDRQTDGRTDGFAIAIVVPFIANNATNCHKNNNVDDNDDREDAFF